jgi:hypothetical protein
MTSPLYVLQVMNVTALLQVEFTMIMTLLLDKHLTLTLAAQTTMEHSAHLIL